jgi:hypothetical protein
MLEQKAAFGAGQAGKFALDKHPGVRFGYNLGLRAQVGLDPLDERAGIAAISEQHAHAWETAGEIAQEQRGSVTINEPGRMDLDGKPQPQGCAGYLWHPSGRIGL